MDIDNPLPEPPVFDDALVDECRRVGVAMPMVFEWYKYVGILAVYIASLRPDAPGARDVPRKTYVILTGLLLRCGRLMRAALELAKKHRFGEALPILSRSICESAIKVMWVARATEQEIQSFMADGLAGELDLGAIIERNVKRRGHMQAIEKRMLQSVAHAVATSGLEPSEIRKLARVLPDMRRMYNAVDPEHGDDLYVVIQKIGSHATHGTWLDLLFHYNEEPTGVSALNYDQVPPDEDGLRMSALLVNEACSKFLKRVQPPEELLAYVLPKIQAAEVGLLRTNEITYGNDFDSVAG